MTAISHRGLRNDFFFNQFTFPNFYLDFSIPYLIGPFYPFFISRHFETFRDISRHFVTFQDISRHFETFPDISRLFETFRNISRYFDFETFPDISRLFDLFSIFFRSFQSRSDFGFLPNFLIQVKFFVCKLYFKRQLRLFLLLEMERRVMNI